jgi:four helix bundle protein
MPTILKFEELEIWKQARTLSFQVFQFTLKEALSKEFRFKEQIKAAAGSVMDNIAEGFDRSSRLEFINFLGIAKGSCGEVKSQLYRALDQKYITEEEFLKLYQMYDGLSTGIATFIIYLNKSGIKGQKFKNRQ